MTDEPVSGGFFAELKRRKVTRVTIVYVIVAWAAIQAADTIFPKLGLPGWSVTLVIALAALGLPVTIALAWVFDVTPQGVRRTGSEALGASILPLPRRRARALAYAGIGVTVSILAWLAWPHVRGSDAALVETRVAIMPFRVSGVGVARAHLREGFPDLLAAALGSDSAAAAVPTRTVLAALDRRGRREADLLEADGLAVARELGSGSMLLGEIIDSGSELAVTATLFDVRSGTPRVTLRVAAHADSLHRLVDGLTNQVVAALDRTPQHRLEAVSSSSRPAIDEYLRGAAELRRGRFDEAAAHFDRAVELDSTFALAAFHLAVAAEWISGDPANASRAARLAAAHKRQLGVEDRRYLEAFVGPDYPAVVPPYAELIALRERVARLYPQRAELWFLAGDANMHFGRLIGREDHLERAAEYFARAIRIDSTFVEPLEHASMVASLRGDERSADRYGRLLLAVDSSSWLAHTHRWGRVGPRTVVSASSLIERFGVHGAGGLYYQVVGNPAGIVEVADALQASAPSLVDHRREILQLAFALAALEGRPDRIESVRDDPDFRDASIHATDLRLAMWWTRDAAAATEAARRLETAPASGTAITPRCILGLWHARSGDTEAARRVLSTLHVDSTGTDANRRSRDFCAHLLAAAIDHSGPRSAERDAALAAFDAMLRSGPRLEALLLDIGNMEAARMWEASGHPARALAAQRRRSIGDFGVWIFAERLQEEGRLAEQVGDRDGAIRAYQRYLEFRTRPEGGFIQRTEAVQARLAALTAE